jgi:hypothetical protein
LFGLLSEAYRCGHSYAITLGMTDLSATSLSRTDWAAERAGDRAPNLRPAREYLRVTTYMRAADYDAAWRINTAGRQRLDGTDPCDVEALTFAGQLHLGAAVIAARTGDADTATGHLDHAQRLAETTGEQPNSCGSASAPPTSPPTASRPSSR